VIEQGKVFYGKHVKVLQYSQIEHPIRQGKDWKISMERSFGEAQRGGQRKESGKKTSGRGIQSRACLDLCPSAAGEERRQERRPPYVMKYIYQFIECW